MRAAAFVLVLVIMAGCAGDRQSSVRYSERYGPFADHAEYVRWTQSTP